MIATMWHYVYLAQYRIWILKNRYGAILFSVALLLLIAASFYHSPSLQRVLAEYYTTEKEIEGLRSLILNVGSALIGASAIVTSLVLFAMQVNIERMPHGLFRRLSADRKLLGAFALAFLLSIGIATLSTFIASTRLSIVILSTLWSISLILILVRYAYRRALMLINPLKQLDILFDDAKNELRAWARRAQRAKPLFKQQGTARSQIESTHDLARTVYFNANSHWTDGATQALSYAMSFARRYAEQGDYEVSGAALRVVVVINTVYIEVKGKTFYSNNLMIDTPLSSDGFISDTLECLRQNVQSAIARRDEQQIKQILRAMAELVKTYLDIDYSSPSAGKHHANLAVGYLEKSVQDVVPHNMADVLIEGQRLMGLSARYLLVKGNPSDVVSLSEKISLIACTGHINEDYRPVTMEGMSQLANITVGLILCKNHSTHFAVGKVRSHVSLIVKLFLNVPNLPYHHTHSYFLGPYYSSTSMRNLRSSLEEMANSLSEAKSDNADAQLVIRNIEQWADGLYRNEKELLLAAINAKSNFTHDMIQWITGLTEILLAVSNSPACDERMQQKIRKHAYTLIAKLSWIPDDEDTVKFVEIFQMTDTLFEAAMDARNRGCEEISRGIGKILLSWTFKGGKYQTGFDIFVKGLSALAVFSLMGGDEQVAEFKTAVARHMTGASAPEMEIREDAARDILELADNLYRQGHWLSHIERAIGDADHQKLRPLMEEIAGLLLTEN
jgi:hypothetical protein